MENKEMQDFMRREANRQQAEPAKRNPLDSLNRQMDTSSPGDTSLIDQIFEK